MEMCFMEEMRLKGKKIAILTSEMYEDLELWYPYFRLQEEGAEIEIISMIESPIEILGRHYYLLKTDKTAKNAHAEDYAGLIIPGGYAPDLLRRNEDVLSFTTKFFQAKKPVAVECQGLLILATAGLLDGRITTAKANIQEEIKKYTREKIAWKDQDVVVDGNLITSRTKQALPTFCREVIRALTK